ncbi:hypothetical protein M8C21_031637, partial [Ambrosia artemisiifolia]
TSFHSPSQQPDRFHSPSIIEERHPWSINTSFINNQIKIEDKPAIASVVEETHDDYREREKSQLRSPYLSCSAHEVSLLFYPHSVNATIKPALGEGVIENK